MNYTMEEESTFDTMQTSSVSQKKTVVSSNEKTDQKVADNDYVEIQRANIRPVMYGDKDLNDVIFTVVKALQNMSRNRFYGIRVLADILSGTGSEKAVKNNLGQIPEFRTLSDLSYDTIQAIIEWMITQHLILKTKERYPVLHSTYDGLHYSEFITENKLVKLKKYLEEDIVLWV